MLQVAVVLRREQIEQSCTSSPGRSSVTANVIIVSTSQHGEAQQLIQQTEVWLDDVRQLSLYLLINPSKPSMLEASTRNTTEHKNIVLPNKSRVDRSL